MFAPQLTCSVVELAENGTLYLAFNEAMDIYKGNITELKKTLNIRIKGVQDSYGETWEVLNRT